MLTWRFGNLLWNSRYGFIGSQNNIRERKSMVSRLNCERAAVSVASNIAEGKGRASDRELVQFLCHSRGSLFEIETQLGIGKTLGYGSQEDYVALKSEAAKIGRMLNGLIRSVAPKDKAPLHFNLGRDCSRSLKPEA